MGHFRSLSLHCLAFYQTNKFNVRIKPLLPGKNKWSRFQTKPYRISQTRASVIQSSTPPPLIQFIYSARDLGNIQFKLQNKTIKGIIYQSGYQKRRLQSNFSLTHVAFSRVLYVNPEGFVLTKPFDKISLRTIKISLGKLERVLFWICHKFWRGPSIVQKSGE